MIQEQPQLTTLRNLNNSQSIQQQHTFPSDQSNQSAYRPVMQDDEKGSLLKEGHDADGDDDGHGGCKHHGVRDRGKGKGRGRGSGTRKNWGIVVYCVFTCLSCLYLEVYCFNTLEQDPNKRQIKSFFTVLVVFMALWSYYQTIVTTSTPKKLNSLPQLFADPLTESDYLSKTCQHCKYPKPNRISHCSTCGNCIMKLDHHCIWTQNCIGYCNQKSFYLFTLYMTIGLAQFWMGTYTALGIMYGSCKFFSFFQPGVYILWIITCFSASVVGVMIVALLISHTMMILTNHTTLMTMKLKKMCPFPFCEFRDTILENQSLNHYDRGQIQNIRSLFGTNIFTAFLPFSRKPIHDFLFEPADPIPTKGQILTFLGGMETEILREEELRNTILQVKGLFKGQKLIFQGQEIIVK